MDFFSFVFLLALVLLPISLVAALVSAARTPDPAWERSGQNKIVTIVLLLVTGGVGSIYYWLAVHRRVRRGSP